MRVIHRREGLIPAGVAHACPGIGPIRHGDAELERAEACFRGRILLEEVFQLLIDRDAAGPTGGIAAAAHDVAFEQLVAGEQAAHAAHVAVAIAAHFVGDAVEDEHAVLEGFERLEDRFQLGERSGAVRPEILRQRAVRGEEDDQPLALLRCGRAGEVRQAGKEGQRRGGDAELAQKGATVKGFHGGAKAT